jgi:hypothetical protein
VEELAFILGKKDNIQPPLVTHRPPTSRSGPAFKPIFKSTLGHYNDASLPRLAREALVGVCLYQAAPFAASVT